MAGSTFGRLFRLTTFGESHGPAIGGVIDGCPAGLELDLQAIQVELDRRRPGQSSLTTQRRESDQAEWLSGILDGKTTGAPLAFLIRNRDAQSGDYRQVAGGYRPSHADFTYERKFGIRDPRGGGRSSARETACRVAAGAVARQFIARSGITVNAFVKQVGEVSTLLDPDQLDLASVFESPVRCPDPAAAKEMTALIGSVRDSGDTVGGVICCVVNGQAAGLGEPVFDKLHAVLAHAMLSINAVKAIEFGSGFAGAARRGSEENDVFTGVGEKAVTRTNHSGGIQGGISNGMPIIFNVAFKPVSTLMRPQRTLDKQGKEMTIDPRGRHDPCVLPRAVPVVEAMAALVMADALLLSRGNTL